MKLSFTKMDATGNDFLLVDCADLRMSDDVLAVSRGLCDRRRGVGADGVICVLPVEGGGVDYRMRIFNADGSEAEMCGNGVRCFAEYLRITNRFQKSITIDTLAGLIEVEFSGEDVEAGGGLYRVNMGAPRFAADDIPVVPLDINEEDFIQKEITVGGKTFLVSAVSMGNPHAVIYTEDLSDELVLTYGPLIQESMFFPKGVNVEFVKIISQSEIRMRVYERGCGETLSCGTGACAAVAAGVKSGKGGNDVAVHLLGGNLRVSWDGVCDHPVYMEGPARAVFTGNVYQYGTGVETGDSAGE